MVTVIIRLYFIYLSDLLAMAISSGFLEVYKYLY